MYMSEEQLVAELERVRQEAEFAQTEVQQIHQIRLALIQQVKDLRADLADARNALTSNAAVRAAAARLRTIEIEAVGGIDEEATEWAAREILIAALSTGGGGPDEALIGYRVRLGDREDDWALFAPEDVQIVRVGPPREGDNGEQPVR